MTQGLQKFTKEAKVHPILSSDKILLSDFEQLNDADRQKVMVHVAEQVNKLTGTNKDTFLEKVDDILPKSAKNQLWENNHIQIPVQFQNWWKTLEKCQQRIK